MKTGEQRLGKEADGQTQTRTECPARLVGLVGRELLCDFVFLWTTEGAFRCSAQATGSGGQGTGKDRGGEVSPPQQDCMDFYAFLVIGAAGAAWEHGPHRLYQVRGLGGPEDDA